MARCVHEEEIRGKKICIRFFEDTDAAAVAALWNDSEQGWNQEIFIPHTAESILRDAEYKDLLGYLVLTVNEEIVGYCTIGRHDEANCSYVNLINVRPDHYGSGFGRRLLVQAVNFAAEMGRERIDLATWAANLRAVPAYKKTGFYWMPGTGTGPGEGIWVHMQNYIPAILSFPFARDFFLKHPDWHGNYQRDVEQKEDDIRIEGMKKAKGITA